MIKRFLIILLAVTGISSACKKDTPATNAGVPNVTVNISIEASSPLYPNLAIVGGWAQVTGGYDGILIYRQSTDNFVAYDCGCPYDCTTNAKAIIKVQSNNITAVCPVCGTTYSILSGAVSKGPGSLSLKQYPTTFDGTYINITN
ncbi:MAG TPA: hypothetical protein VK783_07755 [Bacteroidia bacterium]|jgi:nitrite reductase/ring-hydroxylating ferredoxin subunit|nr:hypothetical protein [Bacteroidia bacterium]